MKFLTKRVFSPGAIILLHVTFSLALIMAWTILKRGWDFSVTSFSNEQFYVAGGPGTSNIAAMAIGALFKYLHFNHLAFYLLNVVISSLTVVVFFMLTRTCLARKLSLYVTAIFAFNPEFAFYNNFVLKENILIFVIVVAMFLYFKAIVTDLPVYKFLFFFLLPLIIIMREPLILMAILPPALLPKTTRRLTILSGAIAVLCLSYLAREQLAEIGASYWVSHIGHYGATKELFEDIYGYPTEVTFGTLLSSPRLVAEYFIRSVLYYMRPGWHAGVKFNAFLVPYTIFVVYVFLASFPYRKYLAAKFRTAYSYIGIAVVLISLIIVLYDPVERYRYSVYQLGFTLLVLNIMGYQEYIACRPHVTAAEQPAGIESGAAPGSTKETNRSECS